MAIQLNQTNYMLCLSSEQMDYLLSTKFGQGRRVTCLFLFIEAAEMEPKEIEKKGFKAIVPPGSVEIPVCDLANKLKCDRKTVRKMIKEMNDLGLIETKTNCRTSIHRIKCLKGWCDDTYAIHLQ